MTTMAEKGLHLKHLVRRFVGALSRRPVDPEDELWAVGYLLPGEEELWGKLSNADRRHSIEVARRFVAEMGESSRDDMAAALLHDVGKISSGLGTFQRVVATIVGPRTKRFRLYFEHEALGAELLREAGSTKETCALVANTCDRTDVAAALRRADHI